MAFLQAWRLCCFFGNVSEMFRKMFRFFCTAIFVWWGMYSLWTSTSHPHWECLSFLFWASCTLLASLGGCSWHCVCWKGVILFRMAGHLQSKLWYMWHRTRTQNTFILLQRNKHKQKHASFCFFTNKQTQTCLSSFFYKGASTNMHLFILLYICQGNKHKHKHASFRFFSKEQTNTDTTINTPLFHFVTRTCLCSFCDYIQRWLRERGARFALDYMRAEDEQTNSICIGPVNKAFHIVMYVCLIYVKVKKSCASSALTLW